MSEHLRFQAEVPGPTLLVFGAIHGNETCGAHAIQKLISEIEEGAKKLKRGTCLLVPVCNPEAFAANQRYIDENLNRVFAQHDHPTTHERKLANKLFPLFAESDYFLDLHSMQSKGDAFVVMNRDRPESVDFCKALGTSCLMKGWPELYEKYPDKQSLCTQTLADAVGIPNGLVECGTNGDPAADKVAYEVLLRCLTYLDMLDGERYWAASPQRVIRLCEVFFRDSQADTFTKDWKNFEEVSQGELIGWRADKNEVRASQAGVIVFPSPVSANGTEWFYLAVEEK